MRILASSLALAAVTATGTTAFAEEPAPAPAFATMDDTGDPSKVDAEVGFAFSTEDEDDGAIVRFDLLGQYIAPNGLGGYAGIAASTLAFDDSDESADAIGNLQLGALFQRALSPQVDIGLRGGLILPTASDDLDGLVHFVGTTVLRPADAATGLPDATWIRLGASPTFRQGGVFLRADVGLDLPVSDGDEVGVDYFGHVNLGLGVAQGAFAASAELQNAVLGPDGDADSDWIHTLALSLRYRGRAVSPFATLSLPLDDEFREDGVLGVAAGLSVAL